MKKQKIQMIVLIAVLVVFIGAYFGLKSFNKKAAEEETAPKYTVLSIPEETKVKELKVSNENGDFDLILQEDDTYKLSSDESLDVDENRINTKINSLRTITSEQIVEGATELSDFGLADPSLILEMTLDDGTTHKIMVGDYNSVSSTYYVMIDDNPTIYTVDSTIHTNFIFDAESIRAAEESETGDSTEGE